MKKVLICFLTGSILMACKKDANQYVGNWEGTYNGADSGIFRFTVDANLKASGEAISVLTNGVESYEGTVEPNGKLILNNGVFYAGGYFQGYLSKSTGSGTWLSVSITGGSAPSGNWYCSKR